MEITHFTTRRNWRKIQRCGFLKPNSPFVQDKFEGEMVKSVPEIHSLSGKRFVTTIPSERVIDWKNYGLFGDLMDYTSGEVELTFPLENFDGVMVREHYFTTAEYSINKYGRNFFDVRLDPMGIRMGLYDGICKQLFQDYMLSSRKLAGTNLSQIKVPEVWIPFSVSVERITAKVKPSLIQRMLAPVFSGN